MENPGALRVAGILTAALLAAACAGSADYPSAKNETTIIVDNTSSIVSSLTVHLVARHGTRVRLGTVRLNERKTFRIDRFAAGSSFQLLAEPIDGRDFASNEFALTDGDLLEWDLNRNLVRYQGNYAVR